MMKRSNANSTSSADNRTTRSSSRSKDARLGDNFRQPSRTDFSSPSPSKSSDETPNVSSNNVSTGCVSSRLTTANTSSSSSSSSSIPLASSQSTTAIENGTRYNNRLSILVRKSSKNSTVTSSVVIQAAIEKVQDKNVLALIRDMCVNVDQKLARKSQQSNLAFTYGNLPPYVRKKNKEIQCNHLLTLYDLFVQLTKEAYKECGEYISSYETIERAFSQIPLEGKTLLERDFPFLF